MNTFLKIKALMEKSGTNLLDKDSTYKDKYSNVGGEESTKFVKDEKRKPNKDYSKADNIDKKAFAQDEVTYHKQNAKEANEDVLDERNLMPQGHEDNPAKIEKDSMKNQGRKLKQGTVGSMEIISRILAKTGSIK